MRRAMPTRRAWTIALTGAEKGVLLRISDDGVGIQPSESSYTAWA